MLVALVLVPFVAALGLVVARRRLQRRVARGLAIAVPPGIVEEGFVVLGGVPQWVSIRGERADNPILLVLHGGPGASYTVFTPDLRVWERDFTVVQWDRRGVGKTLGRSGVAGAVGITCAQMVADALALRLHLGVRLPGVACALLASSAGTLVGLPLVARHPEGFAAFVATDLNVGIAATEAVAGPATRAWFARHGPAGARRFLARLGDDPRRWSAADYTRLMRLRDRTAGPGRGVGAIMLPRMWRSPLHRWRDLRDLVRGLGLASRVLFAEMVAFDARGVARQLAVPCFVFQGADDVFTPPEVAEAYARELVAPQVHVERVPGVGHMGAFVAPERFLELLRRHVRPWL